MKFLFYIVDHLRNIEKEKKNELAFTTSTVAKDITLGDRDDWKLDFDYKLGLREKSSTFVTSSVGSQLFKIFWVTFTFLFYFSFSGILN